LSASVSLPRRDQQAVGFLIGGGGRRLLCFAAREADVVGLAPRIGPDGCGDVASVLLEATAEKIEWIREAVTDDAGNAAGS
jgi:hypothetical protein